MKRFFLLLLLLLTSALGLWFFLRPNSHRHSVTAREMAARGLAEHLAQRFPGSHAIVISNPFTQRPGLAKEMSALEDAGIRGLKTGFGTRVILEAVVFPDLKPEALADPRSVEMEAEATTPLSYMVTDDAFDKLTQRHPGCDIIVSLIGLPVELARTQCWQSPTRPRFALLLPDLRIVGDASAVRSAVISGKLAAFVVDKPGGPDLQAAPGRDFKAEFEKRFVLVTPENIEASLQTYPNVFPAD